jgi:hypothetical protein
MEAPYPAGTRAALIYALQKANQRWPLAYPPIA